jgi:Short C-terminal domain
MPLVGIGRWLGGESQSVSTVSDSLAYEVRRITMGMVRRRTRRRTMMVAGGMAYERGRNEQAADDQTYDAPPPAPPAPAPSADDATSEIERLVSLHDSGSITDEEFAAAKAKVLGI